MSLGDVKRLPAKEVDKYYNRYQVMLGNQVTGSLVDTTIEAATELANYVLPIDDKIAKHIDFKTMNKKDEEHADEMDKYIHNTIDNVLEHS
ncbi:hypothetical protein AC249_AIPGENE25778 [Exaiptasia diaphana]|nr:hypothetical protein AC249_AIPGENE25778 [Exaiptasia diaphana]